MRSDSWFALNSRYKNDTPPDTPRAPPVPAAPARSRPSAPVPHRWPAAGSRRPCRTRRRPQSIWRSAAATESPRRADRPMRLDRADHLAAVVRFPRRPRVVLADLASLLVEQVRLRRLEAPFVAAAIRRAAHINLQADAAHIERQLLPGRYLQLVRHDDVGGRSGQWRGQRGGGQQGNVAWCDGHDVRSRKVVGECM